MRGSRSVRGGRKQNRLQNYWLLADVIRVHFYPSRFSHVHISALLLLHRSLTRRSLVYERVDLRGPTKAVMDLQLRSRSLLWYLDRVMATRSYDAGNLNTRSSWCAPRSMGATLVRWLNGYVNKCVLSSIPYSSSCFIFLQMCDISDRRDRALAEERRRRPFHLRYSIRCCISFVFSPEPFVFSHSTSLFPER